MQLQLQYGNTPSRSKEFMGQSSSSSPCASRRLLVVLTSNRAACALCDNCGGQNRWSRQPWGRGVGGSFAPQSLVLNAEAGVVTVNHHEGEEF
jgi:hypothetical protein